MKDLQVWQDFYAAALAFRDLKPWDWMYDSDIFGVENPATGEIGYCCVMGNAGEVFALGVYPGEEGFKSYLALVYRPDELPESDMIAVGLNQRVLKVEFVDREELGSEDLEQVKALDLKFRGRNQWVQARDHRPGFFPWYLSEEQARFLTIALRQAVDVASRCREDESVLGDEETGMLIRTAEPAAAGLTWSDRYQPNEEIELTPFSACEPLPAQVNKARKELHRREVALLFMLQYHLSPVEEKKYDRPFFPKLAIWIDYSNGMILGFNLIEPDGEMDQLAESFFDQLHKIGFIPRQIGVNSVMAFTALSRLAEELDIELVLTPEEPAFEEVMESFNNFG